MRLQFEGIHARRRLMVFGAVAAVAIVAAACLPPQPAPAPAAPTTTAPVTTTRPPVTTTTIPQADCTKPASAGAASADTADDGTTSANRYAAVVEHGGRSRVLTRTVKSPAEVAQFRADVAAQGEVLSFAPDGEVHALAEEQTWGFLDSNFVASWTEPTATTGAGVRVAELDTGIDTTHPDLTGHFDATKSADIVLASDKCNPPADTTDPSTSGHGTHVAGILAATHNSIGVEGGAPGVMLVPVRVLNAAGSGTYSDVAAGILWAADVDKGNAQVITMSLGGGSGDPTLSAAVASVENLANAHYTHPVITIAAGNSSGAVPEFPASLSSTVPQVLSVSGLCKFGVNTTVYCPSASAFPADGPYRLGSYSSLAWNGIGTPKGIAAPGTEINSTLPGGTYGSKSGTSMATPFVAAAAALVIAHCPGDTATQVVARLQASARDLGPAGPDTSFGYGMLDADNAVKAC